MWSRAELKTKAKSNLFKNYWKAVLVTLIFMLVSGTSFGGTYNFFSNKSNKSDYTIYNKDTFDVETDEFGRITDVVLFGNHYDSPQELVESIPWDAIKFVAIIILLISIVVFLISVFILNPIKVGCMKWYIKNREENPDVGMVLDSFRERYGNTIKIMFLMELYIFFWSLLFVIPGIIKRYEYRMIPYILAEDPDITAKEAFRMTKQMMTGDKWNTFILDLSFFLWALLGLIACGLATIFFVQPYIELTNVELYFKLKELKLGMKDVDNSDIPPNPFAGGNQGGFNDGFTEI